MRIPVELTILNRLTMPVGSGYPPHARVGEDGEYLGIRFHDIPETAKLGEPVRAWIELLYGDRIDYSPILGGTEFSIMEGRKKVGVGRVLRPEE